MRTVGEYLRWAARMPRGWGAQPGLDCCKFAASWAMLNHLADPMAFIRHRYDSEIGALRRIREGGGLVVLWTRGMVDVGRDPTTILATGNIGVIPGDNDETVAAIFTGQRWAALARGPGLTIEPADPLIMWSVA